MQYHYCVSLKNILLLAGLMFYLYIKLCINKDGSFKYYNNDLSFAV